MKAIVFSVEAMLSLTIAVSLLGFAALHNAQPTYAPLYEYMVAQDLLEIGLKSGENSAAIAEWAAGSDSADAFLERKYAKVLAGLGNYCLELEAKGKRIETNCGGRGKQSVSATRLFFDGKNFFELKATVYFSG
ncbi:hypothetical protein H0O03_02710 [Candidatus Micrarchaeota archaeon]|nr:hypothetical protein [Candidatus Micrarchaeota archaeon]